MRGILVPGTLGSVVSTLALAMLSRAAGLGALRPVNATSHWLNGPAAARVTRLDWRHGGVGYATHHAATLFWAVPFRLCLGPRRRAAGAIAWRAALIAAVAAAVDYGATPRRFTPGWEFVLSRRAMAVAYAAMAAGLAAGALLVRPDAVPPREPR